MTLIITGGAGFIGSNLAKRFLESGEKVVCIDNLSLGSEQNIMKFADYENFQFKNLDVCNEKALCAFIQQCSHESKITGIWHMAANSDIPAGIRNVDVDLKNTFGTTISVIKAMRECGIKNLFFASSSAVYGDFGEHAIREDDGPLLPISNYGAMKLASEAAISAAAESFIEQACIFRFPNVVGVPATHGVILDFVRKLKTNPDELEVLGNGTQRKSYLHLEDLIDAMIFIQKKTTGLVLYNIGPRDDGATVAYIAERVVEKFVPGSKIAYGESDRGWNGDVPKFRYDTEKLAKLGWIPRRTSQAAVCNAIDEIIAQESLD